MHEFEHRAMLARLYIRDAPPIDVMNLHAPHACADKRRFTRAFMELTATRGNQFMLLGDFNQEIDELPIADYIARGWARPADELV